jgi:hypothetical protein
VSFDFVETRSNHSLIMAHVRRPSADFGRLTRSNTSTTPRFGAASARWNQQDSTRSLNGRPRSGSIGGGATPPMTPRRRKGGSGAKVDEKSQWVIRLFDPDASVRDLAKVWGVRKALWQKFWDRVFEKPEFTAPRPLEGGVDLDHARLNAAELDPRNLQWDARPKDTPMQNAPPYLLDFDGSLWMRHEENKRIAAKVGSESYQYAVQERDPSYVHHAHVTALQEVMISQLHGVDVYWQNDVEDDPEPDPHGKNMYRKLKSNTSPTGFGTIRIFPFPFTAIFRYDDSPEVVILTTAPLVNNVRRVPSEARAQLDMFVKENIDDYLQDARDLRSKLRALDGQTIKLRIGERKVEVDAALTFEHSQPTVPTDVWRNKMTNEVVSLIPGFKFQVRSTLTKATDQRCMAFICGEPEVGVHPDHFETEDGQLLDEDAGPQKLNHAAMGIGEFFDPEDEGLWSMVSHLFNAELISDFETYLQDLYRTYRISMANEFRWKNRSLSYEFYLLVYENDRLTVEQLRDVIEKYEDESSPLRTALFDDDAPYRDMLDDVYEKMQQFDDSDAARCWYAFWRAVELDNRVLKMFSPDVMRTIDPAEPLSGLDDTISEEDLLDNLRTMGVYEDDDSSRITLGVLNKLFSTMFMLRTMGSSSMSAAAISAAANPVGTAQGPTPSGGLKLSTIAAAAKAAAAAGKTFNQEAIDEAIAAEVAAAQAGDSTTDDNGTTSDSSGGNNVLDSTWSTNNKEIDDSAVGAHGTGSRDQCACGSDGCIVM